MLEVQIRTHSMHEEAELGVCAHWRYKGTDVKASSNHYEEKISWLRQVLEWHEELGDIGGLAEQLRVDIEPDRVYVFTPDGHAIDLPKGATRWISPIGSTLRSGTTAAGRRSTDASCR